MYPQPLSVDFPTPFSPTKNVTVLVIHYPFIPYLHIFFKNKTRYLYLTTTSNLSPFCLGTDLPIVPCPVMPQGAAIENGSFAKYAMKNN